MFRRGSLQQHDFPIDGSCLCIAFGIVAALVRPGARELLACLLSFGPMFTSCGAAMELVPFQTLESCILMTDKLPAHFGETGMVCM
jgi:uncharacterized RDD family membrane protein YckC